MGRSMLLPLMLMRDKLRGFFLLNDNLFVFNYVQGPRFIQSNLGRRCMYYASSY